MSDEKKPELESLVLGQPALKPVSDREAIAEFLARCGYSQEEAQEKAAQVVKAQATLDPGVTYGHLHPEQLADLWKRAAKHGKRKIVLEITADALNPDEWDGHINVEVKDSETWAVHEQAQPFEVPYSWQIVAEEMHREGPKTFEQWQEEQEKTSASRVIN